ncbi:MAG: methyltransferase domain-containing protein [Chloroflexi bacterium]|nr:methyltransferase domain-containing protein [Chloroflexota bacterium]
MWRALVYIVLGLPAAAVVLSTVVRIVRHFHKFPLPEPLANLIDNPLRRRWQPPSEMPLRHDIEPGMTVLEVGPGNGRYTVETACRVGTTGKVVAIDIEPKMVERVASRAQALGLTNLEARTADVYALPFGDGAFDAIYMITVIGELPELGRALGEFHRVLKPGGTVAFSEIVLDPDYPLARTLIRKAAEAGLRLKKKVGGGFSYTLVFEKPRAT